MFSHENSPAFVAVYKAALQYLAVARYDNLSVRYGRLREAIGSQPGMFGAYFQTGRGTVLSLFVVVFHVVCLFVQNLNIYMLVPMIKHSF